MHAHPRSGCTLPLLGFDVRIVRANWHFVGGYRIFSSSIRGHPTRCAARAIWTCHVCGLYVSSAGLGDLLLVHVGVNQSKLLMTAAERSPYHSAAPRHNARRPSANLQCPGMSGPRMARPGRSSQAFPDRQPNTEAPSRRAPEVHSALGSAVDATLTRFHEPGEWNGNNNDRTFLTIGVSA